MFNNRFLTNRFLSVVTLLVLIAFVVAGCGAQQAKAPEKPASAPAAFDAVQVTKDTAWDAYRKVVADVQGKTFPVDAAKAKELVTGNESKYLIIDMRSPEDYAKGHVKGAVNLTIVKLAENLDKLPADKTLLLYCYSGQNTGTAMVPLKAYGYKALSISKGFPMVEKAGFAMDTAATAFTPAAAKPAADPKQAAALAGIKDNYMTIARQMAAKTLVVKGADVKKLVDSAPDKYVYIDLRSADDFAKAHVKGAVSAPLATLQDKAKTFPRDKTLVLYCYSGQTAAMATAPLKAEGFKLISISAGFPQAEAGGLPIEKK
ncbi:rhodanese-like domain-containing protein [Anaeroselena agilis]|uniref:Rhodanese-like domain-containing protein n=1 Tax=Anaeroselena agilis TaxID=3063788 RepID=A0ABU3P5X0_9FIRM|nr:rhodanese-like domain-containing protein [Selenomonadales bacterium 4137-cl]